VTPDQFAYWLQGFAELTPTAPTQEQWQAIRDHLSLVFDKVTPVRVLPAKSPRPLTREDLGIEPEVDPDAEVEPVIEIVRRHLERRKRSEMTVPRRPGRETLLC
jgi:hypothetical protein